MARLFVVDAIEPVATISVGAWARLSPAIGVRAAARLVRSFGTVETNSFETWQPSIGVSFRF